MSLDEKRNKILRSTGEPMVKKLLCVCWIAVVLTGYVNARNPGFVQTAREFPDAQPPNGCTMEENWSLEDAWQETTPTSSTIFKLKNGDFSPFLPHKVRASDFCVLYCAIICQNRLSE